MRRETNSLESHQGSFPGSNIMCDFLISLVSKMYMARGAKWFHLHVIIAGVRYQHLS
jgi:hypothetical protein